MQRAVSGLLSLVPKLTTDMGQSKMDEAVALLDALIHPLSPDDIAALMSRTCWLMTRTSGSQSSWADSGMRASSAMNGLQIATRSP